MSREILEERRSKELRKIESAITLDINFERKVRRSKNTPLCPLSLPAPAERSRPRVFL